MDIKTLYEHFRYYQESERQLLETERYVSFASKSKTAYSILFANILFNACSNFESLVRAFFGEENDNPLDIDQIISLLETNDDLRLAFDEVVTLSNSEYVGMRPLKIFVDGRNNKKNFKWWSNFNKIKHNKVAKISLANQETVISSIAGLYVLNRYILKALCKGDDVDIFPNDNSIFTLANLKPKAISFAGAVGIVTE